MNATMNVQKKSTMTTSTRTKWMVKVGMLSAVAFLLQLIDIPLPIFPSFLKIDFSDVPALLAAFSLGPVAGVVVELVKNILHFIVKTSTGGVGELANFIIGSALVIPAGLLYRRNNGRATAIAGMLIGTVAMTLVGAAANLGVLIPFYANFMPIDAIVGLGSAINPAITDVSTLVFYGVVPFNLFKGVVVTLVTVLIYKRLSPILHG